MAVIALTVPSRFSSSKSSRSRGRELLRAGRRRARPGGRRGRRASSRGRPWPRSRKTRPGREPGGILMPIGPSSVGTIASPPSTAVVRGTVTVVLQVVALRARTSGAAGRARAGTDRRAGRARRRRALAGRAHARALAHARRDASPRPCARLPPSPSCSPCAWCPAATSSSVRSTVPSTSAPGALSAPRPKSSSKPAAARRPPPARARAEAAARRPRRWCGRSPRSRRGPRRSKSTAPPPARPRPPAAAAGTSAQSEPERVVALALVGVGEDLVGLVDLLEARLGLRVALVDVGVVLARQLAVGGLDLLGRGGLRHPEDLVVVLESTMSQRRFYAGPILAGRSSYTRTMEIRGRLGAGHRRRAAASAAPSRWRPGRGGGARHGRVAHRLRARRRWSGEIEARGRPRAAFRRRPARARAPARGAVEARRARPHGGLQILVNNAGDRRRTRPWRRPATSSGTAILATNLTAVFRLTRAALPHLAREGGARLHGLVAGRRRTPIAGMAAYCASKAALDHFARCLMLEVRQQGVKVTTLAPGSVDTGFGGATSGARRRLVLDAAAGGRRRRGARPAAHARRRPPEPRRDAPPAAPAAGVILAAPPAALRVAWRAFLRFQDHHGPDRAAAVAYYTLLSLVPLLIFLHLDRRGRARLLRRGLPGHACCCVRGVVIHLDARLDGGAARRSWSTPSASSWPGPAAPGLDLAAHLRRRSSRRWRRSSACPAAASPSTTCVALSMVLVAGIALLLTMAFTMLVGDVRGPASCASGRRASCSSLGLLFVSTSCRCGDQLQLLLRRLPVRAAAGSSTAGHAAVGRAPGHRSCGRAPRTAFAYYIRNVAQYAGIYGTLEAIIVLALWLEISVSIILYCGEVVAIIIVPARAQRRIAFAAPRRRSSRPRRLTARRARDRRAHGRHEAVLRQPSLLHDRGGPPGAGRRDPARWRASAWSPTSTPAGPGATRSWRWRARRTPPGPSASSTASTWTAAASWSTRPGENKAKIRTRPCRPRR